MTQQLINVGVTANDGTGDTLRVAGQKSNDNFTELYIDTATNYSLINSALNQATIATDTATAAFSLASNNSILAQAAFNAANSTSFVANSSSGIANTALFNAATAQLAAQAAYNQANTNVASSSSAVANNALITGQSAFDAANSTSFVANSTAPIANTSRILAQAAFNAANSTSFVANSTATIANTTYITSGYYGGITVVPVILAAANGRIVGIANTPISALQATTGTINSGASLDNIAIGTNSGATSQSRAGIAIGTLAGQTGQGANSIAIGYASGQTNQPANSIVISASNRVALNPSTHGLFVQPIRSTGSSSNFLQYDTTTKEIRYSDTLNNITLNSPSIVGSVISRDTAKTAWASFTGSIPLGSTTLTVSAMAPTNPGVIQIGQNIKGTNIPAGTIITGFISGTYGGIGLYTISQAPSVAVTSVAITVTGIDFYNIPSWVKRITVMFNGVSTTGSTELQIQIGSATIGSVDATGYSANSSTQGGSVTSSTTGYVITSSESGSDSHNGNIVLCNFGNNIWTSTGILTPGIRTSAGIKSLSDVLDRIRITTIGNVGIFDAGTINLLYE